MELVSMSRCHCVVLDRFRRLDRNEHSTIANRWISHRVNGELTLGCADGQSFGVSEYGMEDTGRVRHSATRGEARAPQVGHQCHPPR
jgi:hypothetical protein